MSDGGKWFPMSTSSSWGQGVIFPATGILWQMTLSWVSLILAFWQRLWPSLRSYFTLGGHTKWSRAFPPSTLVPKGHPGCIVPSVSSSIASQSSGSPALVKLVQQGPIAVPKPPQGLLPGRPHCQIFIDEKIIPGTGLKVLQYLEVQVRRKK